MKLTAFFLLAGMLSSGAMAQDCTIPPSYANQASVVTPNDLWVGFATDRHVYALNDTVRFYLVVKNNGTATFYINWHIDPQDGIFVLPAGCTDLYQPGCFSWDDQIFSWPWIIYAYSDGTLLNPGECRVWKSAFWSISTYRGNVPSPGTYNVLGGMYKPPYASGTPYGQFVVPDGGVLLQIRIESEISVDSATWGSIKALFEL